MGAKRYRYRAYPDQGQARAAARLFGCVRVAWNDALAYCTQTYEATGKKPSRDDVSAYLTASKRADDRAWLREVSSVPLQQSIQDLDRAYTNFFTSVTGKRHGPRMGAPRFKKKSNRQAARFTRNAGFRIRETTHGVGFVTLPKIGDVRYESSRPLPSEPSSATLIKEPDGRYYVSFVVNEPDSTATRLVDERPHAGVDVGLTDLAVIARSDGTRVRVTNPRWERTRAVKLARAQRALSRTQKGSKNREKARRVVAVQHRKTREARADHHHKLALELVRDNQTVALETLSVRGLARTRLARSIADAGWSTLTRLIEEKAARYDTIVVRVGQWEPTTQTCCVCGTPGGKKPLNIRLWQCGSCATVLDRDYNAAVNIMVAAGLAETLNACGDSVRRQLAVAESMKQEPTEQTTPDGAAA